MLGSVSDFRGTSRFVIEGRLGEGGMGVVHRARDTERGEVVALKTMTHLDPASLLRFKREFRALADISHPNVVQLYELFSEGDNWFFTMELVDGGDLLTWIYTSRSVPPPPHDGAGAIPQGTPTQSGEQATLVAPTELHAPLDGQPSPNSQGVVGPGLVTPSARARFAVRDLARLRAALRQLAAGVRAIHAAGKMHCDIKPSNVMVTRAGRVVLLDFGVAGDYRPGRQRERSDEPLVGTPAYMAPEQASFQGATPASDWYAVGVILFEALTRCMPFGGSTSDILLAKQQPLATPPSAIADGVPPDLDRLCVDLLQLDPRTRPTGDEVLRRLEATRGPTVAPSLDAPFVGRQLQLAALHAALASSLAGSPTIVMLEGRSGMGKTALAAQFLGALSSRPDVLVLSGRCYEREAVPFKAIDQVIDELSRWLARLPEEEAYGLLPSGVHALARVFPVLQNARVVANAPDHEVEAADQLEVRRRAFKALKELLAAVAQRVTLVVHIDDLHWGDVDSVQVLEAVLLPPAPRRLLLVCGYRDGTSPASPECGRNLGTTSDALAALREARERLFGACDFRDVKLGELSSGEAAELARALLGSGDATTVQAIAAESHGSPLFVAELARWASEQGEVSRAVALEQVILARLAELPDDARALLETLSVARGPLRHGIAERAVGLRGGHRAAAIVLRNARFVSMRGLAESDVLETSHDRIRLTVAASIGDAQRRAYHLAIAKAFAGSDAPDADAAFEHFLEAGDDSSAREYVLRAAEGAGRALAFLRAASLYRAAITLRAGPADVLYTRLGDALANAGRGADAADAYMEAAASAPAHQAVDLRRIAAEHYLKSGVDERGLEVLKGVLGEVGLAYPDSTEAAVASLLWHEARLRVASLVRRIHRPQSLAPVKLARIDAAFTAATGLGGTDLLRSADFASRALLLALEAGEPVRLGRTLAVAAMNVAARGEGARRRAGNLVRAAERAAAQVDDPHGRALALLAAGFVHFFMGEWRNAQAKLTEADAILRARCRAVAWELANAQAWTCNALILSGELREAALRIPAILEEARARDDRFAQMHLIYPACCAYIVADEVDAAWRVTQHVSAAGPLTAAQWGAFISACLVERYKGDAAAAWERVQRVSPALDGSNLMRGAALVRVCSAYERGLSAVAAAAVNHDRARALRAAEQYARQLSREKVLYGRAMGLMVRAGTVAVRGDLPQAIAVLDEAIPMLDAADLSYLAACARHARGKASGGDVGRELLARSRTFFEAQGVVNVQRCLAMTAPGFDA